MYLKGEFIDFPETVGAKKGVVPATTPAYLALLSFPAGLAKKIAPSFEEIKVSRDLEPEEAVWEKNFINYFTRYKWTVFFFQTPFLILLLLYFYHAATKFIPETNTRFWLTLGLCFGTLVWPFALALNPIFPAATLLFCGLHHLFIFSENGKAPEGIAAGLFIGSALIFHHLVYIPAVVLLIALALRLKEPEKLLSFIGGILPGLLVFAISHYAIFGDPLPAIYHRGGGERSMLLIWKYIAWSLFGLNGAIWMAPVAMLSLLSLVVVRNSVQESDRSVKIGLAIAAGLLFLVTSLEAVLTFSPLMDPDTGNLIKNAYDAALVPSPVLQLNVAGFDMSIGFHTMLFGGESMALIGPCLFLAASTLFISPNSWGVVGRILLRIGVLLGILAAYNPLGSRIFPIAESIHLIGYDLALKFPREAIF